MTRDIILNALFDNTPDMLLRRRNGEKIPFIASFGGGLNSTAGLILLAKQATDIPDLILFADTGDYFNGKYAEKPATYEHVLRISDWLVANGMPPVTWVRKSVDKSKQHREEKYETLEEECLAKKCLPSIAYFGRSCSSKWKHEPQEAYARNWTPSIECWKRGDKVVKAIFYDADEMHRVSIHSNDRYEYWHPLVDMDIGRDECVSICKKAGFDSVPKSSCFFCPEMDVEEIRQLEVENPDLLQRALAMESNAELRSIKGLGKHDYSWNELVSSRYSLDVISRGPRTKMPCMCYDGGGLFDGQED